MCCRFALDGPMWQVGGVVLAGFLWVVLPGCGGKSTTAPVKTLVKGRVVDENNKPAPLVVVTFWAQGTKELTRYDASRYEQDGQFSIECPAGRYKVTLAKVPQQGGSVGGPSLTGAALKAAAKLKQYSNPASTPLEVVVPENGNLDVKLVIQ